MTVAAHGGPGPGGTERSRLPRVERAPHLVTLRQWADEIGRAVLYLYVRVRPRPGFPAPVGWTEPERGIPGWGGAEYLYERDALNAFRRTQDDLWGNRLTWLITGHDEGDRVTLEQFTEMTGGAVAAEWDGCPPAGRDGRRRLGDLIAWQNARPPWAGPRLIVTPLGREHRLTRSGFANILGVNPKTVTQYTSRPWFPAPVEGRLYLLGDLADAWNSRPGKPPARKPPA